MAVKLADLEKPIEPVILPGGREVAVKAITGMAMELYGEFRQKQRKAREIPEGTPEREVAALELVEIRCRLVGELLDGATDREVKSLTPIMCDTVIELATRTYEAVEAEQPTRPQPAAAPAP